MSKWIGPIQVNGGATPTTTPLLDRELYVDDKQQLFVGTASQGNKPINVAGVASSANVITNKDTFSFSADKSSFQVGCLNFDSSTRTFSIATTIDNGDGTFTGISSIPAITFQGVNLTSIPKIVITKDMYGTADPNTSGKPGVDGQLYFKLTT